MSQANADIPQFFFERDGYYLFALHSDGSISLDGDHQDVQGVVNAKALFEGLVCIRKPGTRYVMVHVQSVPSAVSPTIDREAVAALNQIS